MATCGACGTNVKWTCFIDQDNPSIWTYIWAASELPDALRPRTCRRTGGLHLPGDHQLQSVWGITP